MAFSRFAGLLVTTLLAVAVISFTAGCRQSTPEERLEEAVQLLQERQIALATLKLRDLIEDEPETGIATEARFILANVYAQIGRPESFRNALSEMDAVYRQHGPTDMPGFQALSFMVDLHLMLEDYEGALALLEEGIENAAEDERAQSQLVMMRSSLLLNAEEEDRQQTAIDFLRDRMLTADRNEVRGEARELLAQHFRRTAEPERSIQVYQDYIDAFPDDTVNAQLHIAQAIAYRALGEEHQEKAEELFERGADGMEEQIEEELNLQARTEMLNTLALYRAAFGQPEKAEELYRRIMAENPGRMPAIEAQFAIGRLYIDEENWERAIGHYEQIARENPDSHIGMQAEQVLNMIEMYRQQLAEMEEQEIESLQDLLPDAGDVPGLPAIGTEEEN